MFANGMPTDVFAVYTETLDNSATVVAAHWAKTGGKWQREAIAAFPKAQQGTNPLAPKVYCARLGSGDWIAAFVHPVGDRIRRVGPNVKIKGLILWRSEIVALNFDHLLLQNNFLM